MRAPVGRHVLRVEAPGRVTYGAFIDVLEGERPAIVVEPAPVPELERVRALALAAQRGQLARVSEALAQATPPGEVLVLEIAHGSPRALLVACAADGCRRALRITSAQLPERLPDATLDAAAARARSGLAGAVDAPTCAREADAVVAPLVRLGTARGRRRRRDCHGAGLEQRRTAPPQRLRVVVDAGAVGR